MSVRIETQMTVDGKPAVLEASMGEGQWETPSAELKRRLSLLRLPAGHYPDRDYSLARVAVATFGGRVLDAPPRFGSTGKIDEGPGEAEDAAWRETEHPRVRSGEKGGQFTSKGGEGAAKIEEPAKGRPPQRERSREERRAAALKNYKPLTPEKEAASFDAEQSVSRALGGESSGDNEPFDVLWPSRAAPKLAVEVKTLLDPEATGRVNMRPECRTAKEDAARSLKAKAVTVIVDRRAKRERYYWREGVGAFRLGTMSEAANLSELREALTA